MTALLSAQSIYDAPRLPHEWWRDTLPTVPATADWESVIRRVERVADGISLVVLDGKPAGDLLLPSPGTAVVGLQVCLGGSVASLLGAGPALTLDPCMAAVFHYPKPGEGVWRLPAGRRVRLVDVRCTPEALLALGRDDLVELLSARQAGRRPETMLAGFTASPLLLAAAESLVAEPALSSASLKRDWWLAKIREMLVYSVDALGSRLAGAPLSALQASAVARAAALLDERYASSWPAAQLARVAGLSEKALQRGFRLRYGVSVHDYLRERRLQAAARLIDGGATVTQAAGDTGFSSQSHFGKVFRERFGISPRRWRQRGYLQG